MFIHSEYQIAILILHLRHGQCMVKHGEILEMYTTNVVPWSSRFNSIALFGCDVIRFPTA
jgi:hypothetical protein